MASPHALPPNPSLSFSVSGLTPAEAILKIDTEISHHEAELFRLRKVRNTLTPVATLPNEVLAEIFMQCHKDEIEGTTNQEMAPYPGPGSRIRYFLGSQRFIVSWVSRRWRSVSLSHPLLWTFLTNCHPNCLRECIARSRALPLSVSLQNPSSDLVRTHLLELHRIRKLNIQMALAAHNRTSSEWLLERPAPHLTSVNLERLVIPANARPSMRLSHLQELILIKCNFDWGTVLLLDAPLTTLEIISPENKISNDMLLVKLKAMPSLTDVKYLTLMNCLNNQPDSREADTSCTFPNLLAFTIAQDRDTEDQLFSLLHQLELPHASIHATLHTCRFLRNLHHTGRLFEKYRMQTSLWDKEDCNVKMDEKDDEFNLIVSNPNLSSPSPDLTLCLYHEGKTRDLYGDWTSEKLHVALLAIKAFPLFWEDLATVSLTEGSPPELTEAVAAELLQVRQSGDHFQSSDSEDQDLDQDDSDDESFV
ncbi:hypothetical protein BDN72DRAFT_903200 [Pluteus cervinus]|uniref:Uncharacterized protein n=1 Tax=Pluteus cervinus TaxID=181527 RepID=A0ACD3A9D0_9AGAR|nr:hypothetical protein BDN72DRAFT_903200 [Pluteus cervinus]